MNQLAAAAAAAEVLSPSHATCIGGSGNFGSESKFQLGLGLETTEAGACRQFKSSARQTILPNCSKSEQVDPNDTLKVIHRDNKSANGDIRRVDTGAQELGVKLIKTDNRASDFGPTDKANNASNYDQSKRGSSNLAACSANNNKPTAGTGESEFGSDLLTTTSTSDSDYNIATSASRHQDPSENKRNLREAQREEEPRQERAQVIDMSVDETFRLKYKQFIDSYDKLAAQDTFQCDKLESMGTEFLSEHQAKYMDKIEFSSLPQSKYPDCNSVTACDEEMELFARPVDEDPQARLDKVSEGARMCAEVYWRVSRAIHFNLNLKKSRNKSESKHESDRHKMLAMSRLAIRYNCQNPEAALVFTIVLGYYCDNMGMVVEKIRLGRVFYRSLTYNLRLSPNDALVHHLNGRYCYNVSQLSWIERTLANKLFDPKELSFTAEDSEKSLRKAHSMDPKIAPTGLWMARALQAQKKPRQEIIEWIELGLKAKSREPYDDLERVELEEFKRKGKY